VTPDAAHAPLPLLHGFAPAFGWGLRRGMRATRFRSALILAGGIAALAGYVSTKTGDAPRHLWTVLESALLGMVVPLVALGVVGAGFGEEIQEQTLVYHLVRPISRRTLFLARFAAGAVPGMIAAAAIPIAAVLVSGVKLPASVPVLSALVFAAGALVVGSIYFTLAAVFQRGLVAGLVYTFLAEGLFQFLPGSIQNLSLMHHVRSLFHHAIDADFAPLSARIVDDMAKRLPRPKADDPSGMLFRKATQEPWTDTGTAILICVVVAAVALWIGARAVRRRDFALKD
jgi:ABC-type transport system involved in multi-copper enzyme maturation permease subunit